MATPIATAFVQVKPDLTGFKTQLTTDVRKAVKAVNDSAPKINIGVRLIQGDLTKARREIAKVTANLPVTPTISEAARRKAARDVGALKPIEVPVTAKPVTGAAAGQAARQKPVSVDVVPNLRLFREQLGPGVRTIAERVTARVNVGANFALFRRELGQARDIAGRITNARVNVLLNIAAGERERLRRQISEIRGAVVRVTGELQRGAAGAAGGGAAARAAGGTPGTAAAVAKLNKELLNQRDIAFQLAAGLKGVTGGTQDLGEAQRKAAADAAAANEAAKSRRGIEEANAVLQDRTSASALLGAEALEKQANTAAESSRTVADSLQEEDRVRSAIQAKADAAAKQQADIGKRRVATALRQIDIEKQAAGAQQAAGSIAAAAANKTLTLEQATAALTNAQRVAQVTGKNLGDALNTNNAGLIKLAQGSDAAAKSAVESLTASKRLASTLNTEKSIRASLADTIAGTVLLDTKVARTQATERATLEALARARRLVREEVRSGTVATLASAAALRKELEVAALDATAQNKLAIAEANRATQTGRAARGAIAATLSFLGLRAQVLAASAGFIAGTVAVTAFAKAIGSAANLETQLNVFAETAGATADEVERVAETARQLGADITLPGVSAGDAAQAMTDLAKAGLDVEDSIAGARGVLQLATAAEIDNAAASQIAASALNAFGLEGEQATHVADVLANAANASQASIEDMGTAMGQVNAVARQVGLSLEDTAAILTLLARNGLKGSDAGTSLRTALLRLVSPTEQASDLIQSLGLNIRDAEGNVRPEVFAEFGRVTANLSPDVRDAAASMIFGQDAIRAVSIAAREGTEGLRTQQEQLARQGAAADLAAARNKGLAGQMNALASNIDTLGGKIGSVLLPGLTEIAETLNNVVSGFNSAADAVADFAGAIEDRIPGVTGIVRDLAGEFAGFVAKGVVLGPIAPIAELPFFKPEEDPDKQAKQTIAGLQEVRAETIRLRDSLKEMNLPVGPLTKQAEDLRLAIDQVRQGLTVDVGAVPLTPLESSLLSAKKILESLEEADLPTQRVREQIAEIESQILLTQGAVGRLAREGVPDSVVRPVDEVGNRVRGLLTQLRADAQHLDPFDPLSEEAQKSVNQTIQTLLSLGPRGAAALRSAGPQLAGAISESVRGAAAEFTGIEDLVELRVPEALRKGIENLGVLGPAGRAKLEKLGADITSAMADGIEKNDDAIKAAREAVRDAQTAMAEAVADAVRSARSNLESLGQDLASQVAQVIDQMDFGIPKLQRQTIRIELQTNVREATAALREARTQGLTGAELDPFIANVDDATTTLQNFSKTGTASIETLQDALDGLQQRFQRRALQFSLKQAQQELRDARDEFTAISQVGFQTPAQRQALQEAFAPLEEGVAQAKGEIQSFDLGVQIKAFEKIRDSAKEAANEGISRLIDDFQAGRISAKKFSDLLNNQLKPILDKVKKDSGKNLGFTFTTNFLRTFRALVTQAQLLTGFLTVLGTEPGPSVTDPKKVQTAQQKQVTKAQENLRESIKNQKETAQNTRAQVLLLGLILAKLSDPTPRTPLTPAQRAAGLREANERLKGLDTQ